MVCETCSSNSCAVAHGQISPIPLPRVQGGGDVRMYLVLVRTSPRASTKYGRSSRRNLARSTMFSRESEDERTPPRSSDSRCRRNEERLVVFCGGCPIAPGGQRYITRFLGAAYPAGSYRLSEHTLNANFSKPWATPGTVSYLVPPRITMARFVVGPPSSREATLMPAASPTV